MHHGLREGGGRPCFIFAMCKTIDAKTIVPNRGNN